MTRVRFKRASTLAVFFHAGKPALYNYAKQRLLACNIDCIRLLCGLGSWMDARNLVSELSTFSRASVANQIRQLVEHGIIVVEGTPAADADMEFEESWRWGPIAGIYHFGTSYGQFLSVEEGDAILRDRIKTEPPPPLYSTNISNKAIIPLASPSVFDEPYRTMAARRTNRRLSDKHISLDQLSECLFFSLRITAILVSPDIVDLPIKMTPSGGALNPYEAFICAKAVDGLEQGTYHYSALEHSLAKINELPLPPFSTLTANQKWTDDAAALIFLVANFERPMWKYRDPGAYRVVLIEAGHIAQNIMLVATKNGLVANPTCAFAQDSVEALLNLSGVNRSAVYALVLGVPVGPYEWEESA